VGFILEVGGRRFEIRFEIREFRLENSDWIREMKIGGSAIVEREWGNREWCAARAMKTTPLSTFNADGMTTV
jgi:hypothetical protein